MFNKFSSKFIHSNKKVSLQLPSFTKQNFSILNESISAWNPSVMIAVSLSQTCVSHRRKTCHSLVYQKTEIFCDLFVSNCAVSYFQPLSFTNVLAMKLWHWTSPLVHEEVVFVKPIKKIVRFIKISHKIRFTFFSNDKEKKTLSERSSCSVNI